MVTMGQLAFEAYNASKGGVTFDGRPIPKWEALGEDVRTAWSAAATAVWTKAFIGVQPAEKKPVKPVPSLGRIVHFVMEDEQHRPAIITQVWAGNDYEVGLVVFDAADAPALYRSPVEFDSDGKLVGSWHWPEFVPAR